MRGSSVCVLTDLFSPRLCVRRLCCRQQPGTFPPKSTLFARSQFLTLPFSPLFHPFWTFCLFSTLLVPVVQLCVKEAQQGFYKVSALLKRRATCFQPYLQSKQNKQQVPGHLVQPANKRNSPPRSSRTSPFFLVFFERERPKNRQQPSSFSVTPTPLSHEQHAVL